MENKKQYFCLEAYTGNTRVISVFNGTILSNVIVANYDLAGYTEALDTQGYSLGYFVPLFQSEYDKALKQLEDARKWLDIAKKDPICLSEKDSEYIEKEFL